jgi:hypothetical protein
MAAPQIDLRGEKGCVIEYRSRFGDDVSHLFQKAGGRLDGIGDFAIDRKAGPSPGCEASPETTGRAICLEAIRVLRRRNDKWIADPRARESIKRCSAVADGSCQHEGDDHAAIWIAGVRPQ